MPEPAPPAVRGPLKYEIETSSPMVEAGRPFTVYLRISNPYEMPVQIVDLRYPLPVEFIDLTYESADDRLDWASQFRRQPVKAGTTRNPFAPNVAIAMTGSEHAPAGVGDAVAPGLEQRAEMNRVTVQPGNTIVSKLTLKTRRWLMFTPAVYNLQALLTYGIDDRTHHDAIKVPLSVKSPLTALIVGAVLGAVAGNLVQFLVRGQKLSPASVVGSVVLSAVAIVAFARKKDAQPFISVEDFYGGLFLGFLVGTSGDAWVDFVTADSPPKKT